MLFYVSKGKNIVSSSALYLISINVYVNMNILWSKGHSKNLINISDRKIYSGLRYTRENKNVNIEFYSIWEKHLCSYVSMHLYPRIAFIIDFF